MASRLTDKQKKEIIADYVESGSYNATAKKLGVSRNTVKKIFMSDAENARKCQQKKEENTADMITFMDSRKTQAQNLIDKLFEEMGKPETLSTAKLSEMATALGIVIDKFVTNPQKHDADMERLALDKKKAELEALKVEMQAKETMPDESAEENFLEALKPTAQEAWGETGTAGEDADGD